jgi:hypothetical protein
MGEIISIDEVKSPDRRGFPIAGVRARTPDDQTEIPGIPYLRDPGIYFAGSLAMLANRQLQRE